MPKTVVNISEYAGIGYAFRGFDVNNPVHIDVENILEFLRNQFSPKGIHDGRIFNDEGYLWMVVFERCEDELFVHVIEYRFDGEFSGQIYGINEIMEEMGKFNNEQKSI